jgi:triacylglycerol lipase
MKILLLISIMLVIIWIVIWILWRRSWRGSKTRHPIVLVHGILGFDQIKVGFFKQSYFRKVAEHLRAQGLDVYEMRLPKLGRVEERAQKLAEELFNLGVYQVNLICHSMGGLDARYAISQLGCAPKVASLTTIGTPHQGSPLADISSGALATILAKVGLGVISDLGTNKADEFNRQNPDAAKVRYFSVLSSVGKGGKVHPLLKRPYQTIKEAEETSDGLVPISSQKWGKVLFRIRADHWAQIGWSSDYDAPALYARICRKLRARRL